MEDGSRRLSGSRDWMRVAMPSAADLIFVALVGVLLFTQLSVKLLGDAGIGWHIRTGQQILATHAIPRVDPFSSSMQGKPWFAWEWLYDVTVGVLDSAFGLNGVVWLTALVIAAVFAWLFRILVVRRTNFLAALVLVLLAIVASMIHFLARPHVVSWLFTLAWFVILDNAERGSERDARQSGMRWIWALPLLMLVWANVHGGFVVGFVLLGIYWLSAVWEWWRTKEGTIENSLRKAAAAARSWELPVIGLLSGVAGTINPYGWRLYGHIYSYLTNRFLMDHIEEFQSPNFHGISQRCFAFLLLITLAALAVRGRGLRMSQLLTLLFAVYSGLYAARNIPMAAVLMVAIIGPLMQAKTASLGFWWRMSAMEMRLRGHAWPVLGVAASFLIVANGGRVGAHQVANAHFSSGRMPVGAVDFLKTSGIRGPILSLDSWGGYLIYRMYPADRAVVDDRHDLYGEQFLKSYLKMIRVEQGWEEFLTEHESACVLLPRNAALANVLLATARWKALYTDGLAVVLVRV